MRLFKLMDVRYNQLTDSIKNSISNQLSKVGAAFGSNTIFGQIISVLSSSIQNIMLYIEDSLIEQNKYTAQRKKSIYGLAAISGYEPSYGKAAGVQLKMNFVPNNHASSNIILNNKTPLTCTQNGLIYNIILPQESVLISVNKDNNYRYFYAVQGQFESQVFISAGGEYYTQNFKFTGNLDVEYLEVFINNTKWSQAASVYDMKPMGEEYVVKVSPAGGLDIIFGNDEFGKSLNQDDVIKINYLTHDGESGNLNPAEETYFIFNNILPDTDGDTVDGNNIFNITFASQDPVSSGTNSESIDQVRQMIGLNSRSLVLSSPEHYKNFINKFSFCGYNRTWAEKGSMIVNSLIMKNFKNKVKKGQDYFSLSESDFKLSDLQKTSVINCIENSGQQLAGVTYNIFDPELCKYALYVYVKLKNVNCDKEFISNKIKQLIGDFFSNVNSDIFIPKSDIINLLKNNINEIDGVTIYFLSEQNEKAMRDRQYVKKTYSFNPSTGVFDKKIETVYLKEGESPNLGLDPHGNIYLQSDEQFPVLMGGWRYTSDNNPDQQIDVVEPLIVIYE